VDSALPYRALEACGMERQAISHADRTRDAGQFSQPTSAPAFVDTRPEAVTLRKLSDALHDSPRMAAQRKLGEAMHASPRVAAQRKLIDSMFARPVQFRSSNNEMVQRMVLPVYNSALERQQFLNQAKMQQKYFGHGNIIDVDNWFVDKNLSGIGQDEDLHIIGHGSNNSVGGMNPSQLATVIVTDLGLPADYKGRIYLETCDSAADPPRDIQGTYAQRFAQQLMQIRPTGSVIDVVGFAGTFALEDALGRAALSANQPIDERLKPTLRVSRSGAQTINQEATAISQQEIQNIQQEAVNGGINFSNGSGNDVRIELLLRANRGLARNHEKIGGGLTKRYISQVAAVKGKGRRKAQDERQIVETSDKDVRSKFQMTDEEFRDFEWARTHPKSAKALQILHGLAAFSSGSSMSQEHLDPKYWKHVV
jgi:hypothetical protein